MNTAELAREIKKIARIEKVIKENGHAVAFKIWGTDLRGVEAIIRNCNGELTRRSYDHGYLIITKYATN